jgi:hypothetical protein
MISRVNVWNGQVWYKAEESLRSASAAVFVGYSIPVDDVEVIYLFKRGLEHLPPERTTIVEFDKRIVQLRNTKWASVTKASSGRASNGTPAGLKDGLTSRPKD